MRTVGKQSSLRENGFDGEDLEGLAARQRERLAPGHAQPHRAESAGVCLPTASQTGLAGRSANPHHKTSPGSPPDT